MTENSNVEVDILEKPRLKQVERDCPRCHFIILQNEKEECYECTNCGYIDCGDD